MELRRQVVSAAFERRMGVHTAGCVSLRDLDLHAADRVDYEPTGWLVLGRALRKAGVSESDVFLDFGSGKGRVVLQAATYPFRRVLGVEISPQLHRIATQNVERSRRRLRCDDIVLTNAPAEQFDIPDDVTVVYFFNPFHGDLFATVVRALLASFDRNPRPLRIIYHNAREEETLLATGRVEVIGTFPTAAVANPTRIYRVVPGAVTNSTG
jgi:SAM-dependent methyltransferase